MIRNSFRGIINMAKDALLPRGKTFRRVLLGPAKGCAMMLDLQYELRTFRVSANANCFRIVSQK